MIGNARILQEAGIEVGALAAEADRLRQEGATAIFVAIDGEAAGVIAIADPIKSTTPGAVAALKAAGIRVVMLTGDNATTARAVAAKLGITEVEAEVLPQDKSRVVERLRKEGRVVAMAGDGVNDAPALAAADVGVAMGTGTDVAMQSAGVTLVKGDLNGIVRARQLSAATMANIRQNLFFAFVYNAAGVPIAAGVLYPVFGILLSPDRRRGCHGAVLRERDRQRIAAAPGRPLTSACLTSRHTVAAKAARQVLAAYRNLRCDGRALLPRRGPLRPISPSRGQWPSKSPIACCSRCPCCAASWCSASC